MWKYRFVAIGALCIVSACFGYWWQKVRPFLELAPGRIEAFTCSIHSTTAGRLSEMGPQEGDFVKRGDLLFALDRALLASQAEQLEVECQKIQNQVYAEQKQVETSLEAYLSAIAHPEEAQRHLASVEEAQLKMETAKNELTPAQMQLHAIYAQIANRSHAAPFDGIVLKKTKPPGTSVPEGEEIYRLIDPQRIWVATSIAETELSKISVGMKARIRLPAYPGKEWSGAVTWMSPTTLEGQDRIPLRIAIDEPGLNLKPGLSAQAIVHLCNYPKSSKKR